MVKPGSVQRKSTLRRLERELDRLKARFGLAGNLKVVWKPEANSDIQGCVKGSTIYVFNDEEEKAISTLKHEFIEYVLTEEFLNPRIFQAKAHRRSDALVDIIASLI